MTAISLNYDHAKSYIRDDRLSGLQPRIDKLHQALEDGTGKGSHWLGWLHLPSKTPDSLLEGIVRTSAEIRDRCDVFVCIGIGGSYLGTRAAVSFLGHSFGNQLSRESREAPEIYFAGQNISSDYHSDLFELIQNRDICLNVISKSGTTTEPAIAFRLLKDLMVKKYGEEQAAKRIFVTTDAKKGALKALADEKGYPSFVIPDDVGGRYSVLTPVGLLPMAVVGIDIWELMDGARRLEESASRSSDLGENHSYLYAALRYLLYQGGKTTEIMASFNPCMAYVQEWWKQLAGESEGKGFKGIFPASVEYTTDLHSLGQWVQEGNRILFETFLLLESSSKEVEIPRFDDDGDELNYLAGKTLDFVNDKAYKGTAMAHLEGGVPNMTLSVKDRSPSSLGRLFYFFERAVAMTGYLFDVNPFDQPGVELYKNNMFTLLNKPH
ncbi:MAG: glucose-6-phosphate isomerase [Nitrospinaceae bacterium]